MSKLLETIRRLLVVIVWGIAGLFAVAAFDELDGLVALLGLTMIPIAVGLHLIINWVLQKGELEEENE